ncbi:hypothetical protein MTO96_051394, partial [Rhipicephalus appendiculatus]
MPAVIYSGNAKTFVKAEKEINQMLEAIRHDLGRCGTVASVATPGRPDSTALFVEDFNVEDMGGFLANYFLMALVIAV